jgi:hypothetical protein
VICSTEKRFLFTAHPPGRLARLCRKTHPEIGLKKPEPLMLPAFVWKVEQPTQSVHVLKVLERAQDALVSWRMGVWFVEEIHRERLRPLWIALRHRANQRIRERVGH